jgi:hypothetical protein
MKDRWLVVPTLLGLLANIATIQTSWFSGAWASIGIPALFCALGCVYAGDRLSKYRFLKIPGLPLSLESAPDHSLYLTRISGSCPSCSGRLDLQSVGPLAQRTQVVVCRRNPTQHRWVFDPTVLEDVGR